MAFDDIVAEAERAVSAPWGTSVRMKAVRQLSQCGRRNTVVLCEVVGGPAEMPRTVVVKQARSPDYSPDDPRSVPAWRLFRGWAGLQFAATLPGWRNSPKPYGGDRQTRLFVMEDLSGGPDLESILNGKSRKEATAALVLLGETLGRLHALTVGRSEEYQRLRDVLGPGDQDQCSTPGYHLRNFGPRLALQIQRFGVELADGFLADVARISDSLDKPGPFLAYTHGDPCPENCRLVNGAVHLLDFEFGGFRHVLLDGMCGRMRFPTSRNVGDIPEQAVDDMETAYRRELARTCPAAADEAIYRAAAAEVCGYWILENLTQLLPRALQSTRPPGILTERRCILTRLRAFVDAAHRSGHLSGLKTTMLRLLSVLDQRWNENLLPYRAFERDP